MLKKRLQFSRSAALIVVLCMGTSGAYALISSRAATAPSGAIKITTYAFDGQPIGIGNVRVEVAAVGGTQRCDNNAGVTNAAGDNSVTLTDCKVANNGSQKMYRLVSAERDGYSFRSIHINNEGMSIGDANSFPVQKGVTTSLAIYMNPPPTFTPPPADPTPAPATKYKGSVKITSYAFVDEGKQVGIGNVKVTVSAVGGPEKCDANTGTTNAAGDNSVTLSGCEVADNGGPKTYEIKAEREGYALRSVRIVEGTTKTVADNNRFTIKKDDTTNLHVWMTPPPGFVPPGESPSQPGGSGGGSAAGAKNGHIEVTSYVYESDSKQTRQANVKVKVNSVGVNNGDKAQTCDDIEKTTDANGGNAQANPNYAQANFVNCWTGSEGKKQYQLASVEAPSGFVFRSVHVTNGTFANGGKSSPNVSEPFTLTGEKLSLAIWLTKLEQAPSLSSIQGSISDPTVAAQVANIVANLPANSGAGAVHQVVTKSGTVYVPAKNNEASKALAQLMNSLINANQLDPSFQQPASPGDDDPLGDEEDAGTGDEVEGEENDDPTPPTVPANLKAEQDAAGSIILTWDAAQGNPNGETVSYDVERLGGESTDGDDIQTVTETRWKDQGELKYPQEYSYRVYAKDDDDNASEAATVTITTTPLVTNVPGANANSNPDQSNQQPANDTPPVTTITSPSVNGVSVTIPTGASPQPMACAVSDANGDDSSEDGMGDVVVSAQELNCRKEDGEDVNEFDQEVEMSVEVEEGDLNEDAELYAYDGTDWTEVPTSEDGESLPDGSTADYTSAKLVKGKKGQKAKYAVKSKKSMKLAVMKKKKQKEGLNPAFFLPPVILLGAGVAYILYRKEVLFGSAKSYPNGDVDLTLMPRAPEQPPVETGVPVESTLPESATAPVPEPQPVVETVAAPAAPTLPGAEEIPAEPDVPIEVPAQAASKADHPPESTDNLASMTDTAKPAQAEMPVLPQVPLEDTSLNEAPHKNLTVDDLPKDYSGLEPEQIVRPTNAPKDGGGTS